MKYLLLLTLLALPFPAGAATAPRPNILYFYVDDMGWGSIGPNGQAERKAKGLPYVRTPNLDELAARGVNFTHGYGCHVCSPARSSQQSGYHQGHTFADRNDPNNAKKAMRSDDILMGDALSAAGYTTGYWGKWGYGGSADKANPTIDNIQTLPTSHGYQFVLAELHHVRAHTFFQPTLWSAPAKKGAKGGIELVPNTMTHYVGKASYPAEPAKQAHANYPKIAYCDDAYAFAALDFVRAGARDYKKTGKPFFGLFAAQIPHAPFAEVAKLPGWDAAYKDDKHFSKLAPQAQQWAAMVTRIDAHFGNILDALDDPNSDGDNSDSVADNTLVIFQSDNGGPGGANNSVFDANGGLRGTKGKIQEGGIRVPLVMRWPAAINDSSKLKAGSNIDRVVDVTDLLPTFCDLAGTQIPLGLDGVSIAPLLSGTGHQRQREFIIHEAGNGQSIIRGKHKLVRSAAGKVKDKSKKKGASKEKFALYELEADRAETKDISGANPKLVEELKELLLGERVAEPRGFANTYHRWTGGDGASATDADNWSDYEYANAGITYMTDDGAPQLSWTALMENKSKDTNFAKADTDLEFLALELRGTSEEGIQGLLLGEGIDLTGRNEIRVSRHGSLVVNGGTVSSLRWVDVAYGGRFGGHGSVDATLYNGGGVHVSEKGSLTVNADYHESPISVLVVPPSDQPLRIKGTATLAGTLALATTRGFSVEPGKTFKVITADKISGKFKIPADHLIDGNGNRFAISYTDTAVTLTATE